MSVRPPTKPLSILVADDGDEFRSVLSQWLDSAGHQVIPAANGLDGMRLVTNATDLVIVDVLMPEADGLDLITHVRNLKPRPGILAISGGGEHLPAASCTEIAARIGADAVLVKPFTPEELQVAIAKVMRV